MTTVDDIRRLKLSEPQTRTLVEMIVETSRDAMNHVSNLDGWIYLDCLESTMLALQKKGHIEADRSTSRGRLPYWREIIGKTKPPVPAPYISEGEPCYFLDYHKQTPVMLPVKAISVTWDGNQERFEYTLAFNKDSSEYHDLCRVYGSDYIDTAIADFKISSPETYIKLSKTKPQARLTDEQRQELNRINKYLESSRNQLMVPRHLSFHGEYARYLQAIALFEDVDQNIEAMLNVLKGGK